KLTGNNSAYLELAFEYADWLSGQQICRLFQTYNVTADTWNTGYLGTVPASIDLMGLSTLVNINGSYSSLLENAVANFSDIFVVDSTKRCKGYAYIDGTAEFDYVYSNQHAWATVAIMYAGVVLDNVTWKNFANDMVFAYNLTSVDLPPHSIKISDGALNENYVKEDQTFGHLLLSAEFVYAYKASTPLKNWIKDLAWAGAQYFWDAEVERFIYKVFATTGNPFDTLSVHGFGWIDEALIQAYLIWDNTTWRDRAIDDWTDLVIRGPILQNDLICHAVSKADAILTMHYDSSDYWNVMAKRVGLILYSLNYTNSPTYKNWTIYENYEKLFGATANGHGMYADYGWMSIVDTSDFTAWEGASNVLDISLIFRNFQVKNVTINTFTDLYNEFGNSFTGEEAGVTAPTILSTGWNNFAPRAADVGKTLGQVNTSLNVDSINWTVVVLEFANGTEVSFIYEYSWNAAVLVESESDYLWVWCHEAGSWYHNYP
ncbi:hypothetical protein KAR91_71995, partial [Candidatus Pacearchaeota archaeon]|nr:hypothetical protein [Candidatus Pacearchaeota archaeon]